MPLPAEEIQPLAEAIMERLRSVCPTMSAESLAEFAIQVALAELRPFTGAPLSRLSLIASNN